MTALITLLGLEYFVDWVLALLDLRSYPSQPPGELAGIIDETKLRQGRAYHRDTTWFGLLEGGISTAAVIAMIAAGGFGAIDARITAAGLAPNGLAHALVFAATLLILQSVLGLPLRAYRTFRIEARHGFNRMGVRTFLGDLLKGVVLGTVIGVPLFSLVFWLFSTLGPRAWWIGWLTMIGFNLLMSFLAPAYLLPLFNRFTKLDRADLLAPIEAYARGQNFSMSGVYVMDSSTRTAKSNAFFTGFGKLKRLVLFDTLIERQSPAEITAVVAHEVGHFKEGHIPRLIASSLGLTGAMFFVLSFLLFSPAFYAAFGLGEPRLGAGLLFAGIVFSPIMRILSLIPNRISRRYEYEADRFAVRTLGDSTALEGALKKLVADNLSHPDPHPFKVAMDHSHPPILQRLRALRAAAR